MNHAGTDGETELHPIFKPGDLSELIAIFLIILSYESIEENIK